MWERCGWDCVYYNIYVLDPAAIVVTCCVCPPTTLWVSHPARARNVPPCKGLSVFFYFSWGRNVPLFKGLWMSHPTIGSECPTLHGAQSVPHPTRVSECPPHSTRGSECPSQDKEPSLSPTVPPTLSQPTRDKGVLLSNLRRGSECALTTPRFRGGCPTLPRIVPQ